MYTRAFSFILTAIGALIFVGPAAAQFGRPGDWTTSGYDAQRSKWVRSDPKISVASVQKPEFQFLWKMKLNNASRQLNSLTTPVLMDRLIGYKGFRTLGFVAGSSDKVFVMDTDLARMEWERQLPSAPRQAGSIECPGGLTSAAARVTGLAIAPPPVVTSGTGGRGGPAKSGVGEPGEGAVTLTQVSTRRPSGSNLPPRPIETAPYAIAIRRGAIPAYVLSSTGMLHMLNSQHGEDIVEPFKFLPPNANATGLMVLDKVAYTATSGACGGVADGVWALDLATGQVANWRASQGVAGDAGFALGPDGTVYVATGGGELAALEAVTLKPIASYRAGNQAFTSSPVIFDHKGKTLIAAATRDGMVHVLDTANMGSALAKSAAIASNVFSGDLASWQDSSGTRWMLAPSDKTVVALRLVDRNGVPAFEPGWSSQPMLSPLTPVIINGVVFALSSGEFRTSDNKITAAQRVQRSSPAVLYALDGATGKELWSSGKTITSFVHGAGLSGNGGQLYVATYDGTLYAFGFPMEH